MRTRFYTLLPSILLMGSFMFSGAAPLAAQDDQAGDWLLKFKILGVLPDESSTITPINGEVAIEEKFTAEVDISYFVADHWALELVLATLPHEVMAKGTDLGTVDLGEIWLLPPTLTLQYHFSFEDTFHPYVGAGVNYTMFYGDDLPSGGPAESIDYDSAFGAAFVAGVETPLRGNWLVNFDVKKVLLSTDVDINSGAIGADVDIDPWLASLGIGYRIGGS